MADQLEIREREIVPRDDSAAPACIPIVSHSCCLYGPVCTGI